MLLEVYTLFSLRTQRVPVSTIWIRTRQCGGFDALRVPKKKYGEQNRCV